MPSATGSRLVEIDALRGLAALAVVLFHYTTRFSTLYPAAAPSTIAFPNGHYGVNLFFIISGLVIFMTLDNTRQPMDFWVSRFSRLFPAYWAAIFLTFTICLVLGLPGRQVDAGTAFANMLMVHGLFRVPHVDGVYWTLEVELLFYCGMFLLYRLGWLGRVQQALRWLLLLRLVYFGLEQQFGIVLPWIAFRLLILAYLPWFALGVCAYQLSRRGNGNDWRPALQTAALAVATLWICESALVAGIAVVLTAVVLLAARSRLKVLRFGPLVWLGTISYPLYLLHENIGWAIQLRLGSLHMPSDLILLLTLYASLLLAAALTRWVEQPAMRWLRHRYRHRRVLSVQ